MLSRNSGEVLWNGKALSPVTEKVGYLAEERGLYPKYKINEQLTYFAKLRGMQKSDIEKSLKYWFARLELNGYEDKRAEQLSRVISKRYSLLRRLLQIRSFLYLMNLSAVLILLMPIFSRAL